MTHTSQRSGLMKFGPVTMRQMRWIPPRSTSTNMPATHMHAVDRITAGMATFLYFSTWKTLAELATISAAGGEPHEEHEHDDVEAPRIDVGHPRDSEACGKLVDPAPDAHQRQHDERYEGRLLEQCRHKYPNLPSCSSGPAASCPARATARERPFPLWCATPRNSGRLGRRKCGRGWGNTART